MPIHVINLDRAPERLRSFREVNAHLPDFVRFPAIDGRGVDREQLRRDGIVAGNLTYTNGHLGCALSHVALWRAAVAEGSPVTVVEDDAVLAPDFLSARDDLLRRLPRDWSIVLWGWNFDRSVWAEVPEGVARAVLQFDQEALRDNIDIFRRSSVPHAPIRLRHAFGAPCYTVSAGGAAALLETCLPMARKFIEFEGFGIRIPNNGIDCLMNTAYPRMKSYICLPPLAVSENRLEISSTNRAD